MAFVNKVGSTWASVDHQDHQDFHSVLTLGLMNMATCLCGVLNLCLSTSASI
jgi:hypothetical protein